MLDKVLIKVSQIQTDLFENDPEFSDWVAKDYLRQEQELFHSKYVTSVIDEFKNNLSEFIRFNGDDTVFQKIEDVDLEDRIQENVEYTLESSASEYVSDEETNNVVKFCKDRNGDEFTDIEAMYEESLGVIKENIFEIIRDIIILAYSNNQELREYIEKNMSDIDIRSNVSNEAVDEFVRDRDIISFLENQDSSVSKLVDDLNSFYLLEDDFGTIWDYYETYNGFGIKYKDNYDIYQNLNNEYGPAHGRIEFDVEDLYDYLSDDIIIDYVRENWSYSLEESARESELEYLRERYKELSDDIGGDIERWTFDDLWEEYPTMGGLCAFYLEYLENEYGIKFSDDVEGFFKEIHEKLTNLSIQIAIDADFDLYKKTLEDEYLFADMYEKPYDTDAQNIAHFLSEMSDSYLTFRGAYQISRDSSMAVYQSLRGNVEEREASIDSLLSDLKQWEETAPTDEISEEYIRDMAQQTRYRIELEKGWLAPVIDKRDRAQEKLQADTEMIPPALDMSQSKLAKKILEDLFKEYMYNREDREEFIPKFAHQMNLSLNKGQKKHWVKNTAIPSFEDYAVQSWQGDSEGFANRFSFYPVGDWDEGMMASAIYRTISNNPNGPESQSVANGMGHITQWLTGRVFGNADSVHNAYQPFFDEGIIGQPLLGRFMNEQLINDSQSNIDVILRERKKLISANKLIPGNKKPDNSWNAKVHKIEDEYIVPDSKKEILSHFETYASSITLNPDESYKNSLAAEMFKKNISRDSVVEFLNKINLPEKQLIFPTKINIGDFDFEIALKTDPINAVGGNLTGCCFKVGGEAESALLDAFNNPYSTFLNVYNKGTGTLVAQSWLRSSEKNEEGKITYYLDNVETVHAYRHSSQLTNAFRSFAKRIKQDRDLAGVFVGTGCSKLNFGQKLPGVKNKDLPGTKPGTYSDLDEMWHVANNWYSGIKKQAFDKKYRVTDKTREAIETIIAFLDEETDSIIENSKAKDFDGILNDETIFEIEVGNGEKEYYRYKDKKKISDKDAEQYDKTIVEDFPISMIVNGKEEVEFFDIILTRILSSDRPDFGGSEAPAFLIPDYKPNSDFKPKSLLFVYIGIVKLFSQSALESLLLHEIIHAFQRGDEYEDEKDINQMSLSHEDYLNLKKELEAWFYQHVNLRVSEYMNAGLSIYEVYEDYKKPARTYDDPDLEDYEKSLHRLGDGDFYSKYHDAVVELAEKRMGKIASSHGEFGKGVKKSSWYKRIKVAEYDSEEIQYYKQELTKEFSEYIMSQISSGGYGHQNTWRKVYDPSSEYDTIAHRVNHDAILLSDVYYEKIASGEMTVEQVATSRMHQLLNAYDQNEEWLESLPEELVTSDLLRRFFSDGITNPNVENFLKVPAKYLYLLVDEISFWFSFHINTQNINQWIEVIDRILSTGHLDTVRFILRNFFSNKKDLISSHNIDLFYFVYETFLSKYGAALFDEKELLYSIMMAFDPIRLRDGQVTDYRPKISKDLSSFFDERFLQYLGYEARNTDKVRIWDFFPENLRTKENTLYLISSMYGWNSGVVTVALDWLHDHEVMNAVLRNNPYNFRYLPEKYKTAENLNKVLTLANNSINIHTLFYDFYQNMPNDEKEKAVYAIQDYFENSYIQAGDLSFFQGVIDLFPEEDLKKIFKKEWAENLAERGSWKYIPNFLKNTPEIVSIIEDFIYNSFKIPGEFLSVFRTSNPLVSDFKDLPDELKKNSEIMLLGIKAFFRDSDDYDIFVKNNNKNEIAKYISKAMNKISFHDAILFITTNKAWATQEGLLPFLTKHIGSLEKDNIPKVISKRNKMQDNFPDNIDIFNGDMSYVQFLNDFELFLIENKDLLFALDENFSSESFGSYSNFEKAEIVGQAFSNLNLNDQYSIFAEYLKSIEMYEQGIREIVINNKKYSLKSILNTYLNKAGRWVRTYTDDPKGISKFSFDFSLPENLLQLIPSEKRDMAKWLDQYDYRFEKSEEKNVGDHFYENEDDFKTIPEILEIINPSEARIAPESKNVDGFIFEILEKNDPIGIVIGNITSCCQIMNGLGEEAVIDGYNNPNSGFLAIREKSGKIIAQSWLRLGLETNTLYLDNVEAVSVYDVNYEDNSKRKTQALSEAITKWAALIKNERGYSQVIVGGDHLDVALNNVAKPEKSFIDFRGEFGESDDVYTDLRQENSGNFRIANWYNKIKTSFSKEKAYDMVINYKKANLPAGLRYEDPDEYGEAAYSLSEKYFNVLRNTELKTVIVNEVDWVVGALFTDETNSESFSFDVVVHPKYQGMGIGKKLVDEAISIFYELKEVYGDNYYIDVHVINPNMRNLLEEHYGFKVDKHLNQSDVTMRYQRGEKQYKIAGIGDFLQGAESHNIKYILEHYPEEANLSPKEREKIDNLISPFRHIDVMDKSKLFLKYPKYVYYSLFDIERLLEQYSAERSFVEELWANMKKHTFIHKKIEYVPKNLPNFILNDFIENFGEIISTNVAASIFNSLKDGSLKLGLEDDKVHPDLYNFLKNKFNDLYLSISNNSFGEIYNNLKNLYSYPNKDNFDKISILIKNYIDSLCLEKGDGRLEITPKAIQESERIFSIMINLNNQEVSTSQRAVLEAIKNKEEGRDLSSDMIYTDTVSLVEVFSDLLDSYKKGETFEAKDPISVYLEYFNLGPDTIPRVFVEGYHIDIKSIEDIVRNASNWTTEEVRIGIDIGSSLGITGLDEGSDVEYIRYGIVSPRQYVSEKALDNYSARYKQTVANLIISESLHENEPFIEYAKKHLIKFIEGTASEEDYSLLPTDPIFIRLRDRAKDDSGQYYVSDYKKVPIGSKSNFFSQEVYADFLDMYESIIKNMPDKIRKKYERIERENKWTSTPDFVIDYDDNIFRHQTWLTLCSGLFSFDHVKSLIEEWPKDASKVKSKIKTISGEKYDRQLRDYIVELTQSEEKKLNENMRDFLNENNYKSYKVSDFPQVEQFCIDFLHDFYRKEDYYNHQEGVFERIVDYKIKQLYNINIYIISAEKLIDFFGHDELLKNRIHPDGARGVYMPRFTVFKDSPSIIVYDRGEFSSLNHDINKQIIDILGISDPEHPDLNFETEGTLWHEVSHGLYDIAFGGFNRDKDYGTLSGWLNDIEELMVISTGNLSYIKGKVSDAVERNFPSKPDLTAGYLENIKNDLIQQFPIEFFGRKKGDALLELEAIIQEEKEDIFNQVNIDQVKDSIISMFTRFFMGLFYQNLGEGYSVMEQNKIEYPKEVMPPEQYDINYQPNKKDKYILELEKDPEYKNLIDMIKKKEYNYYGVFQLYDLINYIYNFSGDIFDIDIDNMKSVYKDSISNNLYMKIRNIIMKFRDELSEPININNTNSTPEEMKETGEFIADSEEQLGKGWQWLAKVKDKMRKSSDKKATNWYDKIKTSQIEDKTNEDEGYGGFSTTELDLIEEDKERAMELLRENNMYTQVVYDIYVYYVNVLGGPNSGTTITEMTQDYIKYYKEGLNSSDASGLEKVPDPYRNAEMLDVYIKNPIDIIYLRDSEIYGFKSSDIKYSLRRIASSPDISIEVKAQIMNRLLNSSSLRNKGVTKYFFLDCIVLSNTQGGGLDYEKALETLKYFVDKFGLDVITFDKYTLYSLFRPFFYKKISKDYLKEFLEIIDPILDEEFIDILVAYEEAEKAQSTKEYSYQKKSFAHIFPYLSERFHTDENLEKILNASPEAENIPLDMMSEEKMMEISDLYPEIILNTPITRLTPSIVFKFISNLNAVSKKHYLDIEEHLLPLKKRYSNVDRYPVASFIEKLPEEILSDPNVDSAVRSFYDIIFSGFLEYNHTGNGFRLFYEKVPDKFKKQEWNEQAIYHGIYDEIPKRFLTPDMIEDIKKDYISKLTSVDRYSPEGLYDRLPREIRNNCDVTKETVKYFLLQSTSIQYAEQFLNTVGDKICTYLPRVVEKYGLHDSLVILTNDDIWQDPTMLDFILKNYKSHEKEVLFKSTKTRKKISYDEDHILLPMPHSYIDFMRGLENFIQDFESFRMMSMREQYGVLGEYLQTIGKHNPGERLVEIGGKKYNVKKILQDYFKNVGLWDWSFGDDIDGLNEYSFKTAIPAHLIADFPEEKKNMARMLGSYDHSWGEISSVLKEINISESNIPPDSKDVDGFVFEILEKDDPIGIVLGDITSCCQIIGGISEEAVIDGYNNPNSGFLAIREKSGKIIAQSWLRLGLETNTLYLDNVETTGVYDINYPNNSKQKSQALSEAITKWAALIKNERGYSQVIVGGSYLDIALQNVAEPEKTSIDFRGEFGENSDVYTDLIRENSGNFRIANKQTNWYSRFR